MSIEERAESLTIQAQTHTHTSIDTHTSTIQAQTHTPDSKVLSGIMVEYRLGKAKLNVCTLNVYLVSGVNPVIIALVWSGPTPALATIQLKSPTHLSLPKVSISME